MPLGDGVGRNKGDIAYVNAAFQATIRRVLNAREGKRNDTLNAECYVLGQILHAGNIDPARVRNEIVSAAVTSGMAKREAEFTVDHALKEGAQSPRPIPERTPGGQRPRRNEEREREVAARLSAGKVTETPEQRVAAALDVWDSPLCQEVIHSPAWHYLKDTRGLPIGNINPDTARFHPQVVIKEGQKPRPALVLACRDQHQQVVGVQIILLSFNVKSARWERTFKISRGMPKGNPVFFPPRQGSNLKLACEGPEDALSLRMATGGGCYAALSMANIRSLPFDHDERVVMFLDRSKKEPESDEAAVRESSRELDLLCERGVDVWIALPPVGSKDANECYIRLGGKALVECVDAARKYIPTPPPPADEAAASGQGGAAPGTAPAPARQGAASGAKLTGGPPVAGSEAAPPAAPRVQPTDGPEDPGDWADGVLSADPQGGRDRGPPAGPPGGGDSRPPGNGWKSYLIRNSTNFAIKAILHNAALAIEHDPKLQGMVAYDEFADCIVKKFPVPRPDGGGGRSNAEPETTPWADHDTAALTRYMQENLEGAAFGTLIVHEAVIDVAHRNSFHPVREYLDRLKWDGKPRLSNWLTYYLGAEPTEKEPRKIKAERELLTKFGRGFLISAVARIYQPGCQVDTMLILEGPQGNRKNTSQIALFSPWFNETGVGDLTNKDAAISLQGSWCVAFDELDSMRRADVRTLKSFLTRRKDKYRPPYSRSSVERMRQCVFAGTTNEETYLRDTTGSRRFWPVKTGVIDIEALTADRDQLWAEAKDAYRRGEIWHIQESTEALKNIHERRREADPWEEAVVSSLDKIRQETMQPSVTARQIMVAIGLDTRAQDPIASKRILDILRHLGWRRSDERTARGYEWLPPDPNKPEQENDDE